jgi:hypothetical protein
MDTCPIYPPDRPAVLGMGINFFRKECRAVKQCETTGHTPTFYGSAELRQGDSDMFPGGYLHVLVMSKLPGYTMMDMIDLTRDELSIIREQLPKILE